MARCAFISQLEGMMPARSAGNETGGPSIWNESRGSESAYRFLVPSLLGSRTAAVSGYPDRGDRRGCTALMGSALVNRNSAIEIRNDPKVAESYECCRRRTFLRFRQCSGLKSALHPSTLGPLLVFTTRHRCCFRVERS